MKLMLIPESEMERVALESGTLPAPIIEMVLGMASSRAMMAAVELGILRALEDTPATTAGLAARLELDEDGLSVLLELLGSFGIVGFGPRGWMPTPRGVWLLDPALEHLVAFNRDQWNLATNLEARLRDVGPDLHDRPQSEGFWARYLTALAITAGDTCTEIAAELPLEDPARILDVGGGHGLHAVALCQRFESCQARVLDLPAAIAVGAERCNHDRVEFVAGDLRDGDWGSDYDAVLLFNLTPHLDQAGVDKAFADALAALSSGGLIAVLQPRRLINRGVDAQLDASGELLYWLAAGRRPWPEEGLRASLQSAGFVDIQRIALETAPKSLLLVGSAP